MCPAVALAATQRRPCKPGVKALEAAANAWGVLVLGETKCSMCNEVMCVVQCVVQCPLLVLHAASGSASLALRHWNQLPMLLQLEEAASTADVPLSQCNQV